MWVMLVGREGGGGGGECGYGGLLRATGGSPRALLTGVATRLAPGPRSHGEYPIPLFTHTPLPRPSFRLRGMWPTLTDP